MSKFDATAIINGHEIAQDSSLDQYKGEKHVAFFSCPMDLTFICPTELHAFQEKLDEFEKWNVAVVGCSVDSEYSYFSWLQMPKSEGGIQGAKYPIVSDFSKSISGSYGVLAGSYAPDENGNWVCEGALVTFRGLFLIDKEGIMRCYAINDLPLGRNVDEVLRMADALQHFEEYGEACPVNWLEDEDVMKATEDGAASYLSKY